MRTLVKITIPTESGNRTIKDGTLPRVIGQTLEMWKPESAVFTVENGLRTAYLVVDLHDSSQIPALGEPLFMELGAQVQVTPCMNAAELRAGLEKLPK